MSKSTVILAGAVFLVVGVLLIAFYQVTVETRAEECSEILHGKQSDTPLTKMESVEIGACLLEFNQEVAE